MVPAKNTSKRQLPPKATLRCPNCNHENHINGDWVIRIYATYLDYECPECGNTIKSRPDEPNEITPA